MLTDPLGAVSTSELASPEYCDRWTKGCWNQISSGFIF